jgi:predicted nucleic acid-binding Zn ribbon protein
MTGWRIAIGQFGVTLPPPLVENHRICKLPACSKPFNPSGRRLYCTDGCRRRHESDLRRSRAAMEEGKS